MKHLTTIGVLLLLSSRTLGHNGPPFAVVVDQKVGPCIVSIWTDPDIGQGSFFVITQPPENGSLPNDLTVQLVVQPVSGRLPEATYTAQREDLRGQVQYKTMVNFDVQEQWRVRVLLHSAAGDAETVTFVEPTPDGFGRWDLLIYLLPFLAVGFIWLRAFYSRAKAQKKS